MESLSGTLELEREKRTEGVLQERADETSQSLFRISLIFSL